MKTTTKRMTKDEAVDALAAILSQFGNDTGERLIEKAQEKIAYLRAVKAAAKVWRSVNEELKDGDEELLETTGGRTSLTWEEFIEWDKQYGEWRPEWPTPPEPK